MKKGISLFLCIIMVFGLSACNPNVSETEDNISDKGLTAGITENVSSGATKTDKILTDFDGEFIEYIESHTNGNYLISPLSFRYALGLLLSGAKGNTQSEMLSALKIKNTDEWTEYCSKFNGFVSEFDEQLKAEIKRYNDYAEKGYVNKNSSAPTRALKVANSVWKRDDIKENFKADYWDYIKRNYSAEYYSFNGKNLIKKVNDWVNEKTEKLIPKLLDENYDTNNIAVILMNALYYKNSFIHSFDKSVTNDGEFKTKNGKTVKKSFMEQTEFFKYYSDDDTKMVILPMDSGINMAFVMGESSNISEKISKSQSKRVYVKIPKIEIETSLDKKELLNFLAKKGVKDAFNPEKADFSGMIDEKIWVDDIIQKTKIKTDEDGVEAAAVTAIMTKNTGVLIKDEPEKFIADKPFYFFIYADCDGILPILFAGKVEE